MAVPRDRALAFCSKYGLDLPILMAPMAGACPVNLAVAVANAGGMGALGALVTPVSGIHDWVQTFRSHSRGALQLNTWVPDPPPVRNSDVEARVRAFLSDWGPAVPLRGRNRDVAPGLRGSVRGVSRARADGRVVNHGVVSRSLRLAPQRRAHRLVRDSDDACRGAAGRVGRRRCRHRAGLRGGRSSRFVRRPRGGATGDSASSRWFPGWPTI